MVICYWIVKHHLRCFALQFQSNLLRFIRFRTSSIQRLLENSCAFNLLHTLSTSTGVSALWSHSRPHDSSVAILLKFFLLHPCALFCRQQNVNSIVFNRFRTLCAKHPGVGVSSFFGQWAQESLHPR